MSGSARQNPIRWISRLKDKDSIDADSLPEPDVLAAEAMGELVQALGELDALMRELGRAMRRMRSVSCWKKRLVR